MDMKLFTCSTCGTGNKKFTQAFLLRTCLFNFLLSIISEAKQQEHQQIEKQMQKHLVKNNNVITEQQKLYCHFCPIPTEIISKEFFYKFKDGRAIFFCNVKEKIQWMKILQHRHTQKKKKNQ